MDAYPTKCCSRCREQLPLSAFGVMKSKKDGLNGYCKPCMNAIAAEWRAKNPGKVRASQKASKEKNRASIAEYNKSYYAKDADYHRARSKAWKADNPEKVREQVDRIPKEVKAARHKSWRERNLDYARAKRRDHHWSKREANLAAIKDWKRRNPEKNAFYVMKRQAAKLRAIPSWVDMQKVEEIYTEARRLTELTGIKHHVDHIVPLQSPWVCGLHCEANLQILPYYENQSKSNRVWPDMPDLTGCSPLEIAV